MSFPVVPLFPVVVFLSGKAWARSVTGSMRPIHEGDVLHEGEMVITDNGSRADVKMPDGLIVPVEGELLLSLQEASGSEQDASDKEGFSTAEENLPSPSDIVSENVHGSHQNGAPDAPFAVTPDSVELNNEPNNFYRILRSQDIMEVQLVEGGNAFNMAPILSVSIVGGYSDSLAGRTGGYNAFMDGHATYNPRLIEGTGIVQRDLNEFEPELRPFAGGADDDDYVNRQPKPLPDVAEVVEGGNVVSGNVLDNDNSGNGSSRVTSITYIPEGGGDPQSADVPKGGSVTVDTLYGELTINSDGSWEYTSDPFEPHPLPPSGDPLQDVITYTIADADGDTASSTLTIDVLDTVPAIGNPEPSVVDEDDLPSGSDDEKESIIVGGSLGVTPGEDPIDTTFSDQDAPDSLTSGGEKVLYEILDDGHTLRAYTEEGNETVFTVDILNPDSTTGAQEYEFTLVRPLDHDPVQGENPYHLVFDFEVQDTNDLDPDKGSFTVTVVDDIPVQTEEVEEQSVQEDALSGGNIDDAVNDTVTATGSVASLVDAGADEPVTFSLNPDTTGLPEVTSKGELVTYSVEGDVLTGTGPGGPVFTLTLDPVTGGYTFVLLDQLDHSGAENDNEELPLDLSSGIIATDKDNDQLTLDEGSLVINVENDVPAQTEKVEEQSVQEDALSGGNIDDAVNDTVTATGSVASLVDAGADEPVTFSLNPDTTGLPEVTSKGELVTYSVEGDVLTGTGPDGPVFTLTLDPVTGGYTFVLLDQLDHSGAENDNEELPLDLSSGIIATDKDNDQLTLDEGSLVINVENDVPAQTEEVEEQSVQEDALSGGNIDDAVNDTVTATGSVASLVDAGADEPVTFSLNPDTTGLPEVTSKGELVTYSVDGNVLTATGPDGPVFTLTLDPVTGEYTFVLLDQLDHSGGENDNEELPLDLSSGIIATDKDDDQLTLDEGSLVIKVENDVPVAEDDIDHTAVGEPIIIDVFSNDNSGADEVTTVIGVDDPDNGTAVVNPDGTITYTPDPGFTGVETFDYTIEDKDGDISVATVTVTVISVDIDDAILPTTDPKYDDGVISSVDDQENTPITGTIGDIIDQGGEIVSLVVTDEDGTSISIPLDEITVNPDGTFETTVDVTGLVDGELTVTLTTSLEERTVDTEDTILKDTVTEVTIDPLEVVNGEIPTITGTGEPGSTVVLSDDDGPIDGPEIIVEPDGTWSFTPDEPLPEEVDTITADSTDPYGNINDDVREIPQLFTPDENGLEPGDVTVYEAGLPDGSNEGTDPAEPSSYDGHFYIDADPEQIDTVTITTDVETVVIPKNDLVASDTTPIEIETTYGTFTITEYNFITNEVTYVYEIDDNSEAHTDPGNDILQEPIGVTVEDENGDTRSATLTMTVVDDLPEAVDDTGTVEEGGNTVTGNLFDNDTFGADGYDSGNFTYSDENGAPVPADIPETGETTVTTQYGSFTIDSAGNWSYTSNDTVDHTSADSLPETIVYTFTDGDGDTAGATLTINVTDTEPEIDTPENRIVSDANLPEGTSSDNGLLTVSGPLGVVKGEDTIDTTFDTDQTVLEAFGLYSEDEEVKYEIIENGHTLRAYTGDGTGPDDTVFTVVINDPESDAATYTYTHVRPLDHVDPNTEAFVLPFNFSVKDSDNDSDSDTFTVTVLDDVPTAVDDPPQTVEEGSNTITGSTSVLGNDTYGADGLDGATVTYNPEGPEPEATVDVPETGSTVVDTEYGALTINSDGTWSYTSDPSADHSVSDSLDDSFTYTITDGDGDTSSAVQPITVTDTVPEAVDDNGGTVEEGGLEIIGNLLDNDTLREDGGTVTSFTYTREDGTEGSVAVPENGTEASADTQYGTIYVRNTGEWRYVSDASEDHTTDDPLTEGITYTLTDGDTDTSEAVLTVGVTDTVPLIGEPDDSSVLEANLPGGSDPQPAALVKTGDLNVAPGADPLDTQFAPIGSQTALNSLGLTSDGETVNYTLSPDGYTLTAYTDDPNDPVFTVVINDPTDQTQPDGNQNYTFTLLKPLDQDPGEDDVDLTFAFGVEDGDTDTDTDTFTVTVVDEPLKANDDLDSTSVNTPVTIDVLTNDNDPDPASPLEIVSGSVTDPPNGSVTVNPDGTITYTPDPDFTGTDTFEYQIFDPGTGKNDTAIVTVNVIGVDIDDNPDNPDPIPDGIDDDVISSVDNVAETPLTGAIGEIVNQGGEITSLIVTDEDGVEVVVDPAAITVNPDGTFEVPADVTGLNDGILTVTLTATDVNGTVVTTTDTIPKDTVTPVTIDPIEVTNNEDLPIITGTGEPGATIVLTEEDGSPISSQITVQPDGTWSFTPDEPLDNDEVTIIANATDPYGNTNTASRDIPVIVIPDINGIIDGDEATVYEEGLPDGSNTGNEPTSVAGYFIIDLDPDSLDEITLTTANSNTLTLNAVQLTNIQNGSLDPQEVETEYGTLTITGYDPDPDSDPSTTEGSVFYTYAIDENTPAHTAVGHDRLEDDVTISVKDSNGDIRNATLDLSVIDDVPQAVDDGAYVVEGGETVTGNVITDSEENGDNGADTPGADGVTLTGFTYIPEGGTIPVAGTVGSPVDTAYGTLTLNANGSWTYESDPTEAHTLTDPQELLPEEITYTITDADGDTSSATLTIEVDDTVPAISDPEDEIVYEKYLRFGSDPTPLELVKTGLLDPVPGADTFNVTFNTPVPPETTSGDPMTSGGAVVQYLISPDGHTLTAHTGDPNDPVFTVEIKNYDQPGASYEFTLSRPLDHDPLLADPDVTDPDFIHLDFPVIITDSDGDTDTDAFTVTVVDDPPGEAPDALTVPEDGSQTINTNADATPSNTTVPDKGDPDGPSHGTAVINSDGTLTYTPDPDYSGPDELTYTYIDEDNVEHDITVTITVEPISDPPLLSRDAAGVETLEDVSVALGLKAPVVKDATDDNGPTVSGDPTTEGDNPELLGPITMSGIPEGAKLLYADGTTAAVSNGGDITIVLSDGDHIESATGDVIMTSAKFEALRILPPADEHNDFTVTMTVTEYEVDDIGNPLAGVDGANSSTTVVVEVLAITDLVDISWKEAGDFPDTDEIPDHPDTINKVIDEDTALDLTAMLNYSFAAEPEETTTQTPPVADGNNTTPDFDGSEDRVLTIGETGGAILPTGSIVMVNGTEIAPETDGTYIIPLTNDQTIPPITVQPPADFSGDILEDIPVTVSALDRDSDSPAASPTEESDTVYFNLFVNPVAGDVEAPHVSTVEDTAVKFMEELVVTDDNDGSEIIDSIVIKAIPDGWKLYDETGAPLMTGNGAEDWTIDTADITSGAYRNYTILPPGHSSVDETVDIDVRTTDTQTVNGMPVSDTQTVTLPVLIKVTPKGERIGTDSDQNGETDDIVGQQEIADTDDNATADLQMNPSHEYTLGGTEDTWFDLSSDPGDGAFDLKSPWFNEDTEITAYQDNSETTYALFTPQDSDGAPLIGSQFHYDNGTLNGRTLTYTGVPVEIPVQYLDSLEFKPPANYADDDGIEIIVNAKTVDVDPDDGAVDVQITGKVVLTIPSVTAVPDIVSLAVSSPGGDEDTEIPISIRPQSDDKDGSETFTITLDNVPDDAILRYNDVVLTGSPGSETGTTKYEIEEFDETVSLTIQPGLNSDEDILTDLNVAAVSEEGGSVSPPTSLPLQVQVWGVADEVTVTAVTPKYAEVDVDITNEVAFSQVVTGYTMEDDDGSESLTFKLTGLDPQFDISGGTFLGGSGSDRVWVLMPDDLATAKIIVPENYSGTVNLGLVPVTTEREGDSQTQAVIPLSVEITPSPEATITTSTTIPEDALQQVDFSIQYQNGDTDETVTSVWIEAADVDSADFTLYLGSDGVTTLADAAASPAVTDVVLEGGYYKLTGSAIGNVYAQNEADLHDSYTFDIKYEITDSTTDGTLNPPDTPETTQSDAVYELTFTAVTDPITETLGTITLEDSGDGIVSPTSVYVNQNTVITVPVTVTQDDDSAEGPNGQDDDGSEKLEQFIIDGVPPGVTVVGGTYIGDVYDPDSGDEVNSGRWVIEVNPDQAFTTIDDGALTFDLEFAVDGIADQLADINQTITITAVSRDENSSIAQSAQAFTLNVAPVGIFDDSEGQGIADANEPDNIDIWSQNTAFGAIEDTSPTLGQIVDLQISGGNNSSFSFILDDLPPGTVVTGMTEMLLPSGQNVYTASGVGGNAGLQNLLSNITITPPPDWNDNNHEDQFDFTLTLTTYSPGGESKQETILVEDVPVDPVTDPTTIVIDAADVDEDNNVIFTVSFSNSADGDAAIDEYTTMQSPLYLKVDDSDMNPASGGTLYYEGSPISTQTISGVSGVPDGDYYVIENVEVTDELAFTYEPEGNASGPVDVAAYIRTQEVDAPNTVTNETSTSIAVNPVSDGYDLVVDSATGPEDTPIEIVLGGTGLRDTDGSEEAVSALLGSVPDGYLVITGTSATNAEEAVNVGDDGTGNSTNSWSIPLNPDGTLPAYIAVVPGANFSGSVEDITLSVYSREEGLEPVLDTVSFDLEVTPVADPIDSDLFIPTTSFGDFGEKIPINLNMVLEDQDGSETVTLTFTGIGPGAEFFDSDENPVASTYDEGTDTYTLTGVPVYDSSGIYDVNHLTLAQSAEVVQVEVTAFTVDGSDDSSADAVTKTFTLNISTTSGNDDLLYDGAAGLDFDGKGGEDTVYLHLDQDIDFDNDTSSLDNVEILDLGPNGDHQVLSLSVSDVLQSTDADNELTILGDSGDSVELVGIWASEEIAGFTVYTSGGATLNIEDTLSVL
ncbi:outer membrane adhesin like protein [Prosthecochloris aestuarii DSM 271]|uniref:Outer membrane adhesin like protein n=1 Tax=Prosthecochloris aestuarii (strain DSM 271 / SK 413) TaxID=290512 RepID=B4S6Z2_PROA2|nr:Ig-like domain-containing protein [Prosthecochloris aestuarii]ACF45829.1 outer membrane adhesin like protein [Prosthecochloris aestuarii DSM 271]